LIPQNTRRDIYKSYWRTKSFLKDITNLSDLLRSQPFPERLEEVIPAGMRQSLQSAIDAVLKEAIPPAEMRQSLQSAIDVVVREKAIPLAEMRQSLQSAINAVHRLCRPENRDLIPSLARFERDWRISLPLDPAIPFLPDFVASRVFQIDHEISVTYGPSDTECHVTFHMIRPPVSKEVLFTQLDTILEEYSSWNVDPEERRTRQRPNLPFYEERFRVYDLKCAGNSYAAIAKQLFPDVFTDDKKPFDSSNREYRKTMQHVKDLYKAAEDLIKNF
jgi:hypothetical protein